MADEKMKAPFLRTAYNYDRNKASDDTGINCTGFVDPETGEWIETPSLAKQEFAEEVDINTITRRFRLTGELPRDVRMPTYQDFEGIVNYQDAMNSMVEAQAAFMMMPADVRARFANNPAYFVDFCSDEKNREEAIRLGLVPASEDPRMASQPPVPAVVPPAPTPGADPVASKAP